MAKFLITVWPFSGHIFPLIAVAHALQDDGHNVAIYTAPSRESMVRDEGFEYFPFKRIDEEYIDSLMLSRDVYTSRRKLKQLQSLLKEWLLDTVPDQVADLIECMDDYAPDALITETSMLGPFLVLHETRQIPVAVFSTVFACMLSGKDSPPFGMGLPRPHNVGTRLLARGVGIVHRLAGRTFRRDANELRQAYGLRPLTVPVTDYAAQMPLYLVPGLPELDYNRSDLPASVHYVGPCSWHPPRSEPLPEWLHSLPAGRPVVHVTQGTMHTQDPFILQAAADGLGGADMDVVVATGNHEAALSLDNLSSNIHVVRWISHADLLPKTNVLVTTGGAGTIMAALTLGVPLVVIPTDWDKPENARRVVDAGVGLRLPIRHCTPQRLREAVEHVLNSPTLVTNARDLAYRLHNTDGPTEAARLLSLVGGNGRN